MNYGVTAFFKKARKMNEPIVTNWGQLLMAPVPKRNKSLRKRLRTICLKDYTKTSKRCLMRILRRDIHIDREMDKIQKLHFKYY